MNAAVWFGAAVFYALGLAPVSSSAALKELLGPRNAPYFTVAIEQVMTTRFFHLYLACSVVALLHLMAEWLYFGKYPPRPWLWLLLGLCLAGLLQVYVLQPRLRAAHLLRFGPADQRATAERAFRWTHGVATGLNLVLLPGLGLYLWRRANPPDSTRFISTAKFRS